MRNFTIDRERLDHYTAMREAGFAAAREAGAQLRSLHERRTKVLQDAKVRIATYPQSERDLTRDERAKVAELDKSISVFQKRQDDTFEMAQHNGAIGTACVEYAEDAERPAREAERERRVQEGLNWKSWAHNGAARPRETAEETSQ